MNRKPAAPKDAAAVILLDQTRQNVLWIQRNPAVSFLGGWHAFPGGKTDAADADVRVRGCADSELERFIVCAARELFEETGVLLARGGEKLTRGQRASLHDDLATGRFSLAEIFETWGLWLDAADFFYTGFWTTPEFSPVRFKTRFFIAVCPPKQKPFPAMSELVSTEFIAPEKALGRWKSGDVLISPPVLISLKELAANFSQNENRQPEKVSRKLLEKSDAAGGRIDHIAINPHITVFPLRTETLPPATHTNCFIVGGRRFVVIDAASKDEAEQRKLFALVDELIEAGRACREIIVSHLHPDHVGGETALQKHLKEKFGLDIPVSAHRLTAEALDGKTEVQKFIEDGEVFDLEDEAGEAFELIALHTPGHARGHLCFYDASCGFLLTSDNVVGTGSVAIAPPEGNMSDYLASLERMKNLPGLKSLCGSHGAAVCDARAKIESYIAHRLEREKQVLEAIEAGAQTAREIAGKVYAGIDERLFPLAEKSVEAHLEKLRSENLTGL